MTGRNSWRRLMLCLIGLMPPALLAAQADAELPAGAAAATNPPGVISHIEFVGNEVTKPQILLQEMTVKVGDIANPANIERSRQAIMDLGLFVSVEAIVEPTEEGNVLRIIVKEKYFILPVPKLDRDDDNNISLGAELSFDNLAGLNQKLKLRYESENASGANGGKITSSLLSYSYPRVFGTPWAFNTDITQTRSPADPVIGSTTASVYNKEAWVASIQVSRWLNPDGISRDWQAGSGLVWRHNSYTYVEGIATAAYQDAQALGISFQVQNLDVRDYLFSRSGKEYGYSGEYGVPILGSDTSYTRHEFFYRHYFLIDGRPHENIDVQARLGLSSGDIFPGDIYAYALGGSKTLRGYPTSSFTGNSYALINIQYLRPFFGYYPFRGGLFLDVGNAYPSNNELHLGDLKWDIGIGLRLRLKYFVKIDLRVDAAYAYDTGEVRYFFGTKEIF